MAVSAVSNNTEVYKQLSTMQKINSAADNPAGLVISEQMTSQVNGYDVGANNAQTSNDMLKVAEGGLSHIQENLQRMRELSVQASNFIYTDSDRAAIQEEINGLKAGIQDMAKGTEFNTLKLLDGSMADMNLALNPDGTGMEIQMENSTLASLGIENFDVTGTFDISDIDKALEMVSQSRSNIGSVQNALEHVTNYNNVASENLTSARSKIVDLDVGQAVSDMQKNKILADYQQFAMMEKIKNSGLNVNKMLGLVQ